VKGILSQGNYHWDAGKLIMKTFVNFIFVLVGILLFIIMLPFSATYEEFPLILVIGIPLGGILAWLLWDANKASYQKMCSVLTVGLLDNEEKKEEQH